MKTFICGVLCVIAVIFILGSVGACDAGRITLLQCVIQAAIGIFVEWLALKNMDM